MKNLRRFLATMVLALMLSVTAFAGDIAGPPAPAPGDVDSPSGRPVAGDASGPSTIEGATVALVMQMMRDFAWY